MNEQEARRSIRLKQSLGIPLDGILKHVAQYEIWWTQYPNTFGAFFFLAKVITKCNRVDDRRDDCWYTIAEGRKWMSISCMLIPGFLYATVKLNTADTFDLKEINVANELAFPNGMPEFWNEFFVSSYVLILILKRQYGITVNHVGYIFNV